jgi:hypothetical protein
VPNILESAFGSQGSMLSSFFLKKNRRYFYKLSKNLKIILEIVSDTSHNHAKSQFYYFLFYANKMIKSNIFWDLKMTTQICTFIIFM